GATGTFERLRTVDWSCSYSCNAPSPMLLGAGADSVPVGCARHFSLRVSVHFFAPHAIESQAGLAAILGASSRGNVVGELAKRIPNRRAPFGPHLKTQAATIGAQARRWSRLTIASGCALRRKMRHGEYPP